MAVDIFAVEPHKVSRDLKGYTVLFYGEPKTGKTTIASHFPNALLLGFEAGYLAIPGIMALPINKWSEFKQVIKQLADPAAKEKYSNIIVDTADIALDLCEKYICNKNGVSTIGDIPFGGGYKQVEKEFDEALRAIPQMGFGLVMISHCQDKVFKDENGAEYNQIVPTLSNQGRKVVDRMSDVIGFAHPELDEEGNTHTVLYMRGTPRFIAGSRFAYTPYSIEFNYENLVDAIGEAIDKQAMEFDNKFVTDEAATPYATEKIDYQGDMKRFNQIVDKLQTVAGNDFANIWAPEITRLISEHLGAGKRITDTNIMQAEQVHLIVSELEDMVNKNL